MDDCLQQCREEDTCLAVDFDNNQTVCYLHTDEEVLKVQQTNLAMDQYILTDKCE